MGETPSKRRRRGFKDFMNGYGFEECPYKDESKREDWEKGWSKAQREYEAQKRLEQKVQEEWQSFADECPWNSNACLASRDECTMNNCAPWHFRR